VFIGLRSGLVDIHETLYTDAGSVVCMAVTNSADDGATLDTTDDIATGHSARRL
jgi:hypothetical protein